MGHLDDLGIFARIAEIGSLSGAARALDLPKQTVSRRLRELERSLGVQLVQRTTRRFRLTEVGVGVAGLSRELVRIGDEASSFADSVHRSPAGLLRITSDTLLGERFIAPLVNEFLTRYPQTRIEFVTTRRFLDLVEGSFDLAFWIGHPGGRSLRAVPLGPAQVRYCASRGYLGRRGRPSSPKDLAHHDCIQLIMEEVGSVWPFRSHRGVTWVRTSGRLTTNSYDVLYQSALAGLGIALLPAFAVNEDIRAGRLESVLDEYVPPLGSVEMIAHRSRPESTQAAAFATLVKSRFAVSPPWVVGAAPSRPAPRGLHRA